MKSCTKGVSLIFIAFTFVALSLLAPNFDDFQVQAHKTIADDEDEMEGAAGEEAGMPRYPGEAMIDDMGEVVEENG